MSISYEGIGEWCATFVCGAVSEGDIVKVSANGTVGKCTAGDLTVTKRSSDEGSKRLSLLREQAWALMRPYTTDGGFCFRGVEA